MLGGHDRKTGVWLKSAPPPPPPAASCQKKRFGYGSKIDAQNGTLVNGNPKTAKDQKEPPRPSPAHHPPGPWPANSAPRVSGPSPTWPAGGEPAPRRRGQKQPPPGTTHLAQMVRLQFPVHRLDVFCRNSHGIEASLKETPHPAFNGKKLAPEMSQFKQSAPS